MITAMRIGVFLELGLHTSLIGYIRHITNAMFHPKPPPTLFIGSLRRKENVRLLMVHAFGAPFYHGLRPAWVKLAYFNGERFVRTPTYAWDHQSYWLSDEIIAHSVMSRASHITGKPVSSSLRSSRRAGALQDLDSQAILQAEPTPHPLLRFHSAYAGGIHIWETPLKLDESPRRFIYDHYVIGAVLVPGVTYIEMGLGLSTLLNGEGAHTLMDIRFDKPQFLNVSDPRHYQIHLVPIPTTARESVGRIDVYSRAIAADEAAPAAAAAPPAGPDAPKGTEWTDHASMTTHFSRGSGWISAPVQQREDACRPRCDQEALPDGADPRGVL
jgi:acyl transferase domain-containing protein